MLSGNFTLSSTPTHPSFTSYIESNGSSEQHAIENPVTQAARLLIEGETIVAWCRNVLLYPTFSDNKRALLGTLYISDFRMLYMPPVPARKDALLDRSNTLKGEYNVSLCNIHHVYFKSSSAEKFRTLTTAIGLTDKLYQVKVCCKDFREFTFEFSVSDAGKDKEVANALIHYAFPCKFERLFLFTYTDNCTLFHNKKSDVTDLKWLKYNYEKDWVGEMNRVDRSNRLLSKYWRVSSQNHPLAVSPTYPEFVVVPRSLLDNVIAHSVANFYDRRFPVWCWATPGGISLCISADLSSLSEVTEKQWELFLGAITDSHPDRDPPVVVNVSIPISEIQQAYQNLRKLCVIGSEDEFWDVDNTWYRSLETCQWMSYVCQCLAWTGEVVGILNDKKACTVIKEMYGRDLACVVSSLTQICMDGYYRTVDGLMDLIQKCWVALGHHFGLRLYGLELGATGIVKEEVAPVFLLFLDCLSQIVRTYPLDFEYTDHLLIAMWDFALTGLSRRLLLNCLREQRSVASLSDDFSLANHFTPAYAMTFRNPLYAFTKAGLHSLAKELITKTRQPPDLPHLLPPRVLVPPGSGMSMGDVEFWTNCHLRWLPVCQWRGGGELQRQLAVSDQLADVCVSLRQLSIAHQLSRGVAIVDKFGMVPRSGADRLPGTPAANSPPILVCTSSGGPQFTNGNISRSEAPEQIGDSAPSTPTVLPASSSSTALESVTSGMPYIAEVLSAGPARNLGTAQPDGIGNRLISERDRQAYSLNVIDKRRNRASIRAPTDAGDTSLNSSMSSGIFDDAKSMSDVGNALKQKLLGGVGIGSGSVRLNESAPAVPSINAKGFRDTLV